MCSVIIFYLMTLMSFLWSRSSSGIALKITPRDKIVAENEEIYVAARGWESTNLTLYWIFNEIIFFLYINTLHLLYEVWAYRINIMSRNLFSLCFRQTAKYDKAVPAASSPSPSPLRRDRNTVMKPMDRTCSITLLQSTPQQIRYVRPKSILWFLGWWCC